MAEASTDVDLIGVEGFPPGQALEDYTDLLPQYEMAVNVISTIVPAIQILDEDL